MININSEESKWLLLIFFIAIGFGLFFFFFFNPELEIIGDAHEYDGIAWNLSQGKGYSYSPGAPYLPAMDREPGYPLFLAIIYKIFGHNLTIVKLFQIFIFGLSGIIVYLIGKEIFNEKVSRISSLIFVLFPSLANYTVMILRDTLFPFIVLLLIFFLVKAVKTNKFKYFIIAGFIFSYTLYINLMLVGFMSSFVFWYIVTKRNNFLTKKLVSLLLIILPLLIYLPWPMRNLRVFGLFKPNLFGGEMLYSRGLKIDYPLPDYIQKYLLFNISETLAKKIYNIDTRKDFLNTGYISQERKEQIIRDRQIKKHFTPTQDDILTIKNIINDLEKDISGYLPEKVMYKETLRTMELLREGYNFSQIDKIKTKEGLSNIKKRPFKYLFQSLLEMINFNFFATPPVLIRPINAIKGIETLIFPLRAILKIIPLIIVFFAIKGMFITWRFSHCTTILIIFLVYMNLVYGLIHATGRHASPLIAFYLLFCVTGILNFRQSTFNQGMKKDINK